MFTHVFKHLYIHMAHHVVQEDEICITSICDCKSRG